MRDKKTRKLRNIGIIAHIDAGKTTLTERILFYTGGTYRLGNVDEGNTVTDFMVQERERGITIQAAAISCDWKDHQVNIIDTPGHIDFTAEVQRSLRVLDGGVVVFDGVAGVEPQSETVWHQADRYGVPRMAFVNKLDRVGANLDRTVEMIRKRFDAHPVVLQMPIGSESDLAGVVDLVEMKALYFDEESEVRIERIPNELGDEAHARHERLIEALADVDDDIALAYLEGKEIDSGAIGQALREATCGNAAIPVLCGSALRNVGIQPLLDAIVRYLPSPLDVAPMEGAVPGEDTRVICHVTDSEPMAALVFKISTDPYVGKLSFFRVYSGTVRRGMTIYNASVGKHERVGRLVRMHAERREEVDEIGPGDIGAILGLKLAKTGQTICDEQRPVVLEHISFPAPVIEVSIAPLKRADLDKLGRALKRLTEEDPTLYVHQDENTGETIMAGMGELHLEVVVDRLKREFHVPVTVGAPQVAYCETITRRVQIEGRLVKQSGGHGQYAVVEIVFEPLEAGSGFIFESQIRGGAIPREYISAVESGIVKAMQVGPLAKQPVVDIKATLVDGKYHEVDSSDQAFHGAGAVALREAVLKAGPVVMEPVMQVEVVASQDYTGDVIGDLSSRAGSVTGIEPQTPGLQRVLAHVPLARMFGYATNLRSITQGRGVFTMQFSHYQQVSEETRKALVSQVA